MNVGAMSASIDPGHLWPAKLWRWPADERIGMRQEPVSFGLEIAGVAR
jgi:hypothetical protein